MLLLYCKVSSTPSKLAGVDGDRSYAVLPTRVGTLTFGFGVRDLWGRKSGIDKMTRVKHCRRLLCPSFWEM